MLGAAVLACTQVNVLMANDDLLRTDANLQETVLTPSNVNPAKFGTLGTFQVDGQIYAQPLYVSSVQIAGKRTTLFMWSPGTSVYAVDADDPQSTTPLWHLNFGVAVPSSLFNFTDILPEVGILGTPVIDWPPR
jgi:hypothetical protein